MVGQTVAPPRTRVENAKGTVISIRIVPEISFVITETTKVRFLDVVDLVHPAQIIAFFRHCHGMDFQAVRRVHAPNAKVTAIPMRTVPETSFVFTVTNTKMFLDAVELVNTAEIIVFIRLSIRRDGKAALLPILVVHVREIVTMTTNAREISNAFNVGPWIRSEPFPDAMDLVSWKLITVIQTNEDLFIN